MIIELADFRIEDPDDFIVAMEELAGLIGSAEGAHGHTVQRSIESPERFVLLIRWDSVEAHERFRSSPAFDGWKGRLGTHRDHIHVEHLETVLDHGWHPHD